MSGPGLSQYATWRIGNKKWYALQIQSMSEGGHQSCDVGDRTIPEDWRTTRCYGTTANFQEIGKIWGTPDEQKF
jgi:hypothetical protein